MQCDKCGGDIDMNLTPCSNCGAKGFFCKKCGSRSCGELPTCSKCADHIPTSDIVFQFILIFLTVLIGASVVVYYF